MRGSWNRPPLWSQDAKWRLKVALALRESGNATASDELLRRLQQNGADVPVDVGGDSVKPEAWLRRFAGVDQASIPVLQEWLQFLGSSRRTGTAAGGDPLLLSRWFHPTTQNKPVLDQMASLAQDLADSGRAPIPAAFPLMVKDRVAFRTLRGVHVLDAASGRLLWETPGEFSEDALIAGYRSPFDFDNGFAFRRMRGGMWRTDFTGGESGADGHPLTGLLYRNANFGLLASDGARLFVIEDDAVVMHGPAGTGFQLVGDSYENQRRTPGNRLAAYDLSTGREAWAIGGPANGESFDLPLAGNFFFGAPLVDGGELFVVGERDLDIRLYALDPDTRTRPLVAASGPFRRQNRAGPGPPLVDRPGRLFQRNSGLPHDGRLAGRRRSPRSLRLVDGPLRPAASRRRTPRTRTGRGVRPAFPAE